MKTKIVFLILSLIVVFLYSTHYVGATGLDSYLTRNVVSRVGLETSLEWVQRTGVNGYLYVDRQGLPPTPTSYDFGNLEANTTKESGLDLFTITNDASVAIDVSIMGTDMTNGITWTLSDSSSPGISIFGLKVGLEGDDYNIIVRKTSPYNLLVSDLASGASQKWGLKIYTPTELEDGVAKTCTITMSIAVH